MSSQRVPYVTIRIGYRISYLAEDVGTNFPEQSKCVMSRKASPGRIRGSNRSTWTITATTTEILPFTLLEGSDNYNKSLLFDQICECFTSSVDRGWFPIALIRRSFPSRPLSIL
jgi:hypothetical protein